jgi:hypothetical protein
MLKFKGPVALAVFVALGVSANMECVAQTPEQQQMWDAQRAQALADEKAQAERLARDRAARKADPMAWVRSLNPMSAGGWEFQAVASDGSWAAYTTTHQMKRTRKSVTVWLRQEYAEPQVSGSNHYLSIVEKVEYDCEKDLERPLLVVYYSANNIQGSETTEEADKKTTTWDAIVPGTREEINFQWACGSDKSAAHH